MHNPLTMMIPQELVEKTVERFPEFAESSWTPIYQGGSNRAFYRCKNQRGASLILIEYDSEKLENHFYASHALFLEKAGIHVPHVMAYSAQECLLWLQDLGEKNLWSLRDATSKERRYWYELALVEAARWHRLSPEKLVEEGVTLASPFNAELYCWEQSYFFEYALGSFFKIDPHTREHLAKHAGLEKLMRHLAALPPQLIHRDLQSQNILLFEQNIWFIDFQGMRAGLAPYDLASLLCDPYVRLSHIEQKELLDFYRQDMEKYHFSFPYDLETVFWQCAVQRLMQALGCYGYLGLHRGKNHFLQYIPSALKNLHHALQQLDVEYHCHELSVLLERLMQ